MMTSSALKRRKLNDASSKLLKPFVSPLRRPKIEKTAFPTQPYLPSTLAHTVQFPPSQDGVNHVPTGLNVQTTPAARSSPIRRPGLLSAHNPPANLNAAELAAHKDIRALEQQVRQVQVDIDTLQQATRIIRASTDVRLAALMEKWRSTSQVVAEELFDDVKERVLGMGGVAAWRESEKQKYGRGDRWGEEAVERKDVEEGSDSREEEYLDQEHTGRTMHKRQTEQEVLEATNLRRDLPGEQRGGTQAWREQSQNVIDDHDDDDIFTMEMMLQSLNIELNVIGYDKVAQRWTSDG